MKIDILPNKRQLGKAAAEAGAAAIREALQEKGEANIVLATGASQFEMLENLVAAENLDWRRVTCFHLDEYVRLPIGHPASFYKYLRERFLEKLPAPPKVFHFIRLEGNQTDTEVNHEIMRMNELLADIAIDVAFIGIGENGHLAFNDPPADFATKDPFIVVELDEACRRQQFGEGWFEELDDVPKSAVSMSVNQILKAELIVCSVPDERKARAVQRALEGTVTAEVPASILQEHKNTILFLDRDSASLLARS